VAHEKQRTEVKGKTKQSKEQKKSAKAQEGVEGNALGKENRDRDRGGNT